MRRGGLLILATVLALGYAAVSTAHSDVPITGHPAAAVPPSLSVTAEPGPGLIGNTFFRGGDKVVARFRLVAQGGPVTVTQLRVRYTGTASTKDFQMSLFVDKNANENVDAADAPIKTRGFVGDVLTYENLALTVPEGATATVLMTLGCSPTQAGKTLRFEMTQASDVTVAAPAVLNPATRLPLGTPDMTISNPLLTVSAVPGSQPNDNRVVRMQDTLITAIRLVAQGSPVTITSLKIRQLGSATLADYSISLWQDSNGNGTWEPTDTRVASRGYLEKDHVFDRQPIAVPASGATLFLRGGAASPTQIGKTLLFEVTAAGITLTYPAVVNPVGLPVRTPELTFVAPPAR